MLANLILIYHQSMSGTGASRQFVSKAVRLGSRAAVGHPSLALGQTALAVHDKAFSHESVLQMRRGLFFTILALLSLLASVAMAMDNNWSGAALGCVAAGCLFVMAIL
jgi:hypothetical protein